MKGTTSREKTMPFLPQGSRLFFFTYVLVLLSSIVFVLVCNKAEIHIRMNTIHSPFLDHLMKYLTFLGEGYVVVIAMLPLLYFSYRSFLVLLSSYVSSGLIAQFLKRVVFPDNPRPVKYFELNVPEQSLPLVDGIEMIKWLSFPSGHATTAFAVFFAATLLCRNRYLQVLFLLLAMFTAYSRVYLSQHFLVDILAGSALGMISAWLCWRWIYFLPQHFLDMNLGMSFSKIKI